MGALPPFVFLVFTLASFAAAGVLLAWIIGRISGKKDPQEHEQPSTAASPVEPEVPAPEGEQELLRVSRTKKGELAVFVRGRRYSHLQKITDPEAGREAIEAIKVVVAFAEDWLPSIRQRAAAPDSLAPQVDQTTFIKQLRQAPPPAPKTPVGLQGMLPKQAPRTMLEPLTFVDEINDLVQLRLQERPEMAGRSIHLSADGPVGLSIRVGAQTFEAVSEITDPQVKALIQDVIREWESA